MNEALRFWLAIMAISVIPLGAFLVHPSLGAALGIITPIPLAYGMRRRNVFEGLLAISAVAVATSLVQGVGPGLLFAVETFPLCLAIFWAIGAKGSPHLTVLAGVGMVAAAGLIAMFAYSAFADITISEAYHQTLLKMGFLMESISSSDVPPENLQQVQWVVGIWKNLFVGIWLSTVTLLLAFYTVLTRGILVQKGFEEEQSPSFFARWNMPFPFVGIFAVLATMIIGFKGPVQNIALNGLIVLGTFYGIQGMVIMGHFFAKWSIPNMFRILLLMFMAMSFPMALILAIALVGLFDTWLDFRRRFPIAPEED